LAGRTSGSNGRPSARGRARASVALGLLSVACLPAAFFGSRLSDTIDVLWSAVAAVPGFVLGLWAVALARGVRRRAALALGRIPGARAARLGRVLGFLGVYAAVTAGLAVAFYALLSVFGD
jgi:hypothetical protein